MKKPKRILCAVLALLMLLGAAAAVSVRPAYAAKTEAELEEEQRKAAQVAALEQKKKEQQEKLKELEKQIDQRVVLWPSLSLENTAHRVLVEPVGPQPVYRLRGDTQQAAPAKDRRRLRDGVFVRFRMEYDGLHHPNLVSSALLFRRSGKTPLFTAPGPPPRE